MSFCTKMSLDYGQRFKIILTFTDKRLNTIEYSDNQKYVEWYRAFAKYNYPKLKTFRVIDRQKK